MFVCEQTRDAIFVITRMARTGAGERVFPHVCTRTSRTLASKQLETRNSKLETDMYYTVCILCVHGCTNQTVASRLCALGACDRAILQDHYSTTTSAKRKHNAMAQRCAVPSILRAQAFGGRVQEVCANICVYTRSGCLFRLCVVCNSLLGRCTGCVAANAGGYATSIIITSNAHTQIILASTITHAAHVRMSSTTIVYSYT